MSASSRSTKKLYLIIAAGLAAALLLFVVILVASLASTRSTAVQKETDLSAQYNANRAFYSGFVNGFYEQTGLAKAKSDKLDEILIAAVRGRYTDAAGNTRAPLGGDSQIAVNVIQEAYPNLSGLDIYDKISDYVRANRGEYADMQAKMASMVSDYRAWKARSGFLFTHSMAVGMLGLPTDELRVTIGNETLTGQAALDKMEQLVEAQKATEAYQTGVDEALTLPGE